MTRRGARRLAALAGIVTIGLALLAGVMYARSVQRQREYEEAYTKGMTLYEAVEEGDPNKNIEYERALEHLEKALTVIKDDPELLKAFAVCRAAVKQPNNKHMITATGIAKAVVAMAPEDMEAKEILLELYTKRGFLTETVDLADEILERDSGGDDDPLLELFKKAMLAKTDSLKNLIRYELASESADAMIDRFPNDLRTHQLWDEIAIRLEQPASLRLTRARELSDRFSDDPNYYMWIGKLERNAGNIERASEALRRAASLEPDSATLVLNLTDEMRSLHRTVLDRNPTSSPEEPSLETLADALFERSLNDPVLGPSVAGQALQRTWWGNRTERARTFARNVGENPEDPYWAWWASLVLIGEQPRMGEPLDSNALAPLADLVTEDTHGVLLTAMDRLRAGENEWVARSLAEFEVDIDGEDDPDEAAKAKECLAVADYIRGTALYRMGDYRGATISLRNAAEAGVFPRDRAWKALGDTYAADGNFEAALNAYQAMFNRSTVAGMDRWDNVLSRAEQLGDPLRARDALEVLRRDAADTERGPTIDVRLARAMILGGETDAGIDLARNLINSDPQPDPIGLIGLASTLRLYEPELGEELLAGMTVQTENIELLAMQALALARADRLDEARDTIQGEIEGRTKDDALPYRRALVRVLDEVDAEDATQAAVAISDDYPESATAQLSALRTKAIWEDLDAARQAVSRLRSAVGERSFAWQTFDARVTLESNPSDEELTRLLSNEDEVEGEEVLDLSDLLREVPDDFDALVVTARVHRMIADRAREAGRNTDAAQSVDLAAKYYDRAAGGGLRAFAFKPYITMLDEYGRDIEASRALDRFVTIDEIPSGAVVERRELLVEAGRYAEAAEDQDRVAGYGYPESKLYLAKLYILAGDRREAIAKLNKFLDQREWDNANLETAANLLAEAGAIARSLEVFGMLPDPHNGSPRDAVIARALMRVGRQEDALLYQLSAARELNNEDGWLSAIRVAEAIGDPERTAEVIREAQDALPDSPAIAAFTDENSTRKFSLAIAAATEPGENPGATEFRDAALAHGRGEITDDEFLNRLETICNDTPGLLKAWRTRIEFNFLLDRAAEGITVAQKAAETLPDNPDAIRLLVKALRGEGMADEAIGPAERLLALTMGDRFQPTVVLALLESDRGNVQRVVSLLSEYRDRLIEDSADTPSSGLTALATAYAGLGNPAEASSLFMQRLDGDSPEWQRAALFALRALPDREITARRQWLAMITSATFAWDRAEQYLRLAQFSGEVSDAERALDLIETHGDDGSNWLWIKANAEGFAGRESEAEATFRRLQEREPDAAFVPQALGEFLSHLEGRAEDALAALDAAEQVAEPGDTELLTKIRINRARALNALDRPQEALELLTPVLEPSDPPMTAVVLSGISYLKLGNLDRASEASQQAQEAPILDARTARELRALQSALD